MTVKHGDYTHADGVGYIDPKCPNCTIEELKKASASRSRAIDTLSAEVKRLRKERRDLRRALRILYEHPPVQEALAPIESLGSIRAVVEDALRTRRKR
jgi:superfamily II helicase